MSFTLDEMTSAIQSQTGLPYEKARAIAHQNIAAPTRIAATTAISPSDAYLDKVSGTDGLGGAIPAKQSPSKNVTVASPNGEKGEQLAIKRSAIARGAFVYEVSQPRATMQTPGIPDLYLVWPTHALWWECKTATGVLSQPQARFMAQCVANGTPHGVGTHADFLAWCAERGIRT